MKTIRTLFFAFLLISIYSCASTLDFNLAQEQVRLYEEFDKMDSLDLNDEASSQSIFVLDNSIQPCKPCERAYQSSCNPSSSFLSNSAIRQVREIFCNSSIAALRRPIVGGCGVGTCRDVLSTQKFTNPNPFDKITLTDINGNTTNLPFEKKGDIVKVSFPKKGNFKMKLINGNQSNDLNINVIDRGLFLPKNFKIRD